MALALQLDYPIDRDLSPQGSRCCLCAGKKKCSCLMGRACPMSLTSTGSAIT